jgi:hypothetical protein
VHALRAPSWGIGAFISNPAGIVNASAAGFMDISYFAIDGLFIPLPESATIATFPGSMKVIQDCPFRASSVTIPEYQATAMTIRTG